MTQGKKTEGPRAVAVEKRVGAGLSSCKGVIFLDIRLVGNRSLLTPRMVGIEKSKSQRACLHNLTPPTPTRGPYSEPRCCVSFH